MTSKDLRQDENIKGVGTDKGKKWIDGAMRNSNIISLGNENAPEKKGKKERAVITEKKISEC